MDLRCKVHIDHTATDRELFMNMENSMDLWLDAELPSVLLYLAENKHLSIPASWHGCMMQFIEHVRREVLWINWNLQCPHNRASKWGGCLEATLDLYC